MNQVICVLSGNHFAHSNQQHLPQSDISKTAHHCTSLSSLQKYLNSSFPMPHSLPTFTENIPKATSHPLVWFLWHSAVSADPHMHIWLNTQTHQPPPLSHREGWPELARTKLSAAWFSSHRWDTGTWGFRNLCCDLCSTSLQKKLNSSLAGYARDLWDKEKKNIQVRMVAPGLWHLL